MRRYLEALDQIESELTSEQRIELKLDALLSMDVGAMKTYEDALYEVARRAGTKEGGE